MLYYMRNEICSDMPHTHIHENVDSCEYHKGNALSSWSNSEWKCEEK